MRDRKKQGYVLALVLVITLVLASVASLVAMNSVRNIQSDGNHFVEFKQKVEADSKLERYSALVRHFPKQLFSRDPDAIISADEDYPHDADTVLRELILDPAQETVWEENPLLNHIYQVSWGLNLTITDARYLPTERTFVYTVLAETTDPSDGSSDVEQVQAEIQIMFEPEADDSSYLVSFSSVSYLSYDYLNG